jgi:RNA polymerase sigma-70 factor (ECF subfamily)
VDSPHNPAPRVHTTPDALEAEVAAVHLQYSAQLLTYALSVVRNRETALDALQETFLRYFIERSYGRVVEHPKAWLYRVLRNWLLDWMDRAALRARREVSPAAAAAVPDASYSPEARIRNSQIARQLAALLSPREMECLRLRADGLHYGEIAEVLGVREGTVSAMLTRVHMKLRRDSKRASRAPFETLQALRFLFGGSYAS